MEGEAMSVAVSPAEVRIPAWVVDLDSFRRWAKSDAFPTQGWFSYLGGGLWVDLSMERLAQNKIKGAIAAVLEVLVKVANQGQMLSDRMRLTHVGAELSTEPDAMFVSNEAIRTGRVVLAQGEESVEVEGTPDMVLEVVSPTSVQKDTVMLPKLYWEAEIPEYWLVDPRQAEVRFDILKYTAKGYVATRRQGGWLKSAVFSKSFRLTHTLHELGYAIYSLEVR
jgi:Uma2 family endonuclease